MKTTALLWRVSVKILSFSCNYLGIAKMDHQIILDRTKRANVPARTESTILKMAGVLSGGRSFSINLIPLLIIVVFCMKIHKS